MRDEYMRQRMPKPFSSGALPDSVVARILPKDDWKQEGMKEIIGNAVKCRRPQPFAIALRSLAKAGIIIRGLFDAGIKGGDHNRDWFECVAKKKVELLPRLQRANPASSLPHGMVHGLDFRLASGEQHYSSERPGVVLDRKELRRLHAWTSRGRGGRLALITGLPQGCACNQQRKGEDIPQGIDGWSPA